MRANFVFRLQRVLELYEMRLEEAQKQLAHCIQKMQEAQQHFARLLAERDALNQSWKEAATDGLRVDVALNFQRCFDVSTSQCKQAARNIDAIQKEELDCRAQLNKALTKKKVIESLRDRQRERFESERNKMELAQLDEIGTQAHLAEER